MSLTTQSAGLVRQKAYNAVYGTGTGTASDSVSPYHFYAIKAFFLHMAANKGNPDLQFVPYSAEQATDPNGTSLVGGACTLYVWFVKGRRTSATTQAFETLYDGLENDSTGDSDATGDAIAMQLLNLTGQQFLLVHPNGFPVVNDLNIFSTTTEGGTTESSAANSSDGFVIVG
jgi:hypothetical protein